MQQERRGGRKSERKRVDAVVIVVVIVIINNTNIQETHILSWHPMIFVNYKEPMYRRHISYDGVCAQGVRQEEKGNKKLNLKLDRRKKKNNL